MTQTLTSALPPLYAALATAINTDAKLLALLAGDRVYSLTAPRDAVPDYIVLGSPSSSSAYTFGRSMESHVATLHVWTAGEEAARALAIYAELFRVLNMQRLTMSAFLMLTGTLNLVTIGADPGGEMTHLVAQYRPLTMTKP